MIKCCLINFIFGMYFPSNTTAYTWYHIRSGRPIRILMHEVTLIVQYQVRDCSSQTILRVILTFSSVVQLLESQWTFGWCWDILHDSVFKRVIKSGEWIILHSGSSSLLMRRMCRIYHVCLIMLLQWIIYLILKQLNSFDSNQSLTLSFTLD